MNKNPKIKYGKVNLLTDQVDPKDEAVRISIVMEGDLLDELKERAAIAGRPYQTVMKELLRDKLGLKSNRSKSIRAAEVFKTIEQRLENVEKALKIRDKKRA